MDIKIKRFTGLYTQPNPLNAPEGSLSLADECVIDREDMIQNRRGFDFFGGELDNPVNSFLEFKNTILAQNGESLSYNTDDGWETYDTVIAAITGQRVRGKEMNGSLFSTTDDGIYKLDALENEPRPAGVPQPLDIEYEFTEEPTGFLVADSAVAYRMTWARKDANDVTTESAPSQRTLVINALQNILSITESSGTATATTEGPHGYGEGDIVTVSGTVSRLALTALTQSSGTVTATTVSAHGLNPGDIIEISGADPEEYNGTFTVTATPSGTTLEYVILGDPVSPASGFGYVAVDPDAFNGTWVITDVPSDTTFEYELISIPLEDAAPAEDETMTVGKNENVELTFPVPENIVAGDLIRIYRSEQTATADLTPSDNMQLVFEGTYDSGDEVSVQDKTTDDFKGAYLYTGVNQQGIAQSNDLPPKAVDIAAYKTFLFYANTQTKQSIDLQLLSVDGITRDEEDFIVIGETQYRFSTAEDIVGPDYTFKLYADIAGADLSNTAGVATIDTDVDHGLAVGDVVFISGATDARYNNRFVVQTVPSPSTFTINVDSNAAATDAVTVSTGSPSQNIARTVQSLIRVINRTHEDVYAFYTSGPDDIPGSFTVVAIDFNFEAFEVLSSNPENWSPELPDEDGEFSTNDAIPNRLYWSKDSQPDSVPFLNYKDVGPRDEKILRIVGLRDSLFIIKERTIWQMTGEDPSNFVWTLFDSSVACNGPDTVAVLDNTIYMFTNQGVVSVGSGGVVIISRQIESDILPFGQYPNASTIMYGVSYESERKYMFFHQALPTDQTATAAYVYNTITRAWTRWLKPATAGIVVGDHLYLGNTYTDTVLIERKTLTKTDKKDESVAANISAIDVTGTILTIPDYEYGDFDLSVGQLIEQSGVYAKVIAVDDTTVTVDREAGFEVGACTVANPIRMAFKLLPQTAESPDMMKQFREVQAYPLEDSFSMAIMTFSSDLSRIDKTCEFSYPNREQGWGFTPWGEEPWGDIGVITGATPLRTYVPLGLQRCRGLIVGVSHAVAQENIAILNVGYVFTVNSERTTR